MPAQLQDRAQGAIPAPKALGQCQPSATHSPKPPHLYETPKLGLQQAFGFSFAELALGVSRVVIHQSHRSKSFFKV